MDIVENKVNLPALRWGGYIIISDHAIRPDILEYLCDSGMSKRIFADTLTHRHLYSRLLALLCILSPSQALILNVPTAPTGFSAILTNKTANVTWTLEAKDPSHFDIELQNNITLDSFELARNVSSSLLKLIVNMTDVPGRCVVADISAIIRLII